MEKQSAVEWLVDKVFCKHTCKWKDVIEQAKEMEKEQTETLYTEDDLRKAYFKGAADVHDKCTERTWRGVEVNVDIQKLKECNEQFMQSLKTKTK